MTIERRGFLGEMSLGMLAVAGGTGVSRLLANPAAETEPWLQGLTGRHKQYFDVSAHLQGAPLGRTANFFNAYVDAYSLKDSDVNVVFGAHGTAIPMVFNDALWSKYALGAKYSIVELGTKNPAVRNIFAGAGTGNTWYDPSIASLQKRGVRFLACLQAIARVSRELASREGVDAPAIKEELIAGLLPGVTPVPAAIVAVNRAQEAGMTYVYLG
jgi:intracellular sulfur oxidation DsrE/DsrF family protein